MRPSRIYEFEDTSLRSQGAGLKGVRPASIRMRMASTNVRMASVCVRLASEGVSEAGLRRSEDACRTRFLSQQKLNNAFISKQI